MTTAIDIDTHAGWDVEVIIENENIVPDGLERSGPSTWTKETMFIPAGTLTRIAIFDTRRIASIKELRK